MKSLVKKQWRIGLILFAISFLLLDSSRLSAATFSAPKTPSTVTDPQLQFKSENDKTKFYWWIVREMYSQVYLLEPKDQHELANWVNVLLQGGSLEGIYHGLVLSNDYGRLERGTASLKAVRFFAEEMAFIQSSAIGGKGPEVSKRIDALVKENINTPLFTLKRMMGEALLLEISNRKKDRAKLAEWFASTVVHWNSYGISYGLPERNKPDFDFHKKWALSHPIGILQWELLNRLHRTMNQLGGVSLGGK